MDAGDFTIPCQWGTGCPNAATTWRLSTASPMPRRMAILNEMTGAWQYPVCESHQVPMETPPVAITARMDRWAAHLREVLRKSLGIAPPRDPWNEEAP